MFFQRETNDPGSHARTGAVHTGHGSFQTPVFMPVGTLGSVKGVHHRELQEDIGAQIILGNTYHLFQRPGLDLLEKAGGLHRFINWPGPMLTDSGGYQVYSLGDIRDINEEGATFRSHIDGTKYQFTPENVMDTQRSIGADIIMAFDECTPYPCDYNYAKTSMELTHRWLDRCCRQFDSTSSHYDYEQFLFPIVQGSTYEDLRKQSAEIVASMERSGNAIGGLSVGEPAEEMYAMTELVCRYLPEDKPRYLMGVGTPVNLLECIALGIDMFDCVLPTRNGRKGQLYTTEGIINIKNAKWKEDFSALDAGISGYASNYYSKAYLRHLFKSGEMLGAQIASVHNLSFYCWLMQEARNKIREGSFAQWKDKMTNVLGNRL